MHAFALPTYVKDETYHMWFISFDSNRFELLLVSCVSIFFFVIAKKTEIDTSDLCSLHHALKIKKEKNKPQNKTQEEKKYKENQPHGMSERVPCNIRENLNTYCNVHAHGKHSVRYVLNNLDWHRHDMIDPK